MIKLKQIVKDIRKKYPDSKINIWASLECTHFSIARGGLPKDADSRTLAEHLFMYVEHLDPDAIFIENVKEFMTWGPLDENDQPIDFLKGCSYHEWKEHIKGYGYDYDHRVLNAADYGAYTSRVRYFSQFVRRGGNIEWPEQTHSKHGDSGFEKWRPVKDILDLLDEGKSIFNRKRPLVDKTLKRIYGGLVKFADKGDEHFMSTYYGNGSSISIDSSCPTLTTKDRVSKISIKYLVNPQFNNTGSSINNPCFTLIARMDKAPPYLMSADMEEGHVVINEDDSEVTKQIKQVMIEKGISDIKMRMLRIDEMLTIMGFPEGYKLKGTKAQQKKMIGNAVECNMARCIIDAHYNSIKFKQKTA